MRCREFVEKSIIELKNFEKFWEAQNKENPTDFPNEKDWDGWKRMVDTYHSPGRSDVERN